MKKQLKLEWTIEYKSYEELIKIENIMNTIMNQKRDTERKGSSNDSKPQLTLPGISWNCSI